MVVKRILITFTVIALVSSDEGVFLDRFRRIKEADGAVDEVLKKAFAMSKYDDVHLPNRTFSLGDVLPEGRGTLAKGKLSGTGAVWRQGESELLVRGKNTTLSGRIFFPGLAFDYETADIESADLTVRATLRGEMKSILATLTMNGQTGKMDVAIKSYLEFQTKHRTKYEPVGTVTSALRESIGDEVSNQLVRTIEIAIANHLEAALHYPLYSN